MSIDDLENLCIQIQKPNSKPFPVATWYRPPNSNVDKFYYFETFIDMLDAEKAEYYLLGDLNCDLGSPALESSSRLLIGITELYGLHHLISELTRITETYSTMIDQYTRCSSVSHVGVSDHSLIYALPTQESPFYSSLQSSRFIFGGNGEKWRRKKWRGERKGGK